MVHDIHVFLYKFEGTASLQNLRMFHTIADGKRDHQHIKKAKWPYQQQQGNEAAEKFPRFPCKIAQFCELLS